MNILCHFGVVVVFFLFLRRLSELFNCPKYWATIGAALFSVHPLVTEPVNYIQARAVILYTFFLLVATLFLIKAIFSRTLWGKTISFVCVFFATILSGASKEVGLVFTPLFLFLTLWLMALKKGPSPRKTLLMTLGVAVTCTICFALFGRIQWIIQSIVPSITKRLFFVESGVFWRYVSLMVYPVPWRLNVDHYVPWNLQGGMAAGMVLSVIALASLVIQGTFLLFKDKKTALWGYFILWIPLGFCIYFLR